MTQQKETLNEFINRRMAELGLKSKVLTDAGIGAWTFKKIRERPYALSESDFQKIAYALQCSIGDLKARVPASIREDAGHEMDLLAKENGTPSVMETVAKLEQMVEEKYPELGSSADNVHVSEENAQNSNENVQKPEQNVQDQEENAQEPEEAKVRPTKPKTKKNELHRYNRAESPGYQICGGRSEGNHGGRVPAAAEGYVSAAVPDIWETGTGRNRLRRYRRKAG